MWVGARLTRNARVGRGVDTRAENEAANGPTDSHIPTEKNWPIGRQTNKIDGRKSLSCDANEMLVRLEVHGVLNQRCHLTTERRRVGSSLRCEVDTVGVASEDHMWPP